MKKAIYAVLALCTLSASTAFAGSSLYTLIPATGSASETKTRAFAGLNWQLGGGMTPALVLGVSRVKVKSDGDTSGGNLAFHVNLAGGVAPGKLKLSYINGKENIQGEAGIGYDFLKNAPLLGLGVNGPYIGAGVDAYMAHGFIPHVTLHSQDEFDKPNQTAAQCVETTPVGDFSDPACTTVNN
jgi:hypothetical protein